MVLMEEEEKLKRGLEYVAALLNSNDFNIVIHNTIQSALIEAKNEYYKNHRC